MAQKKGCPASAYQRMYGVDFDFEQFDNNLKYVCVRFTSRGCWAISGFNGAIGISENRRDEASKR